MSTITAASLESARVLTPIPTTEQSQSPHAAVSVNLDQDALTSLTAAFQSSALEDKASVTFIDTCAGVAEMIGDLTHLPAKPPSLYIDLEGVNLSRHGTISILQIFVLPQRSTFLIDIYGLKDKAFSYPAPSGTTLRAILESPSIPKVFFDVRNDSDALFSHYQIELSGVQDLQLMELATRKFSKRCVNGLGKCIENDAGMTADERANWKAFKDKGENCLHLNVVALTKFSTLDPFQMKFDNTVRRTYNFYPSYGKNMMAE